MTTQSRTANHKTNNLTQHRHIWTATHLYHPCPELTTCCCVVGVCSERNLVVVVCLSLVRQMPCHFSILRFCAMNRTSLKSIDTRNTIPLTRWDFRFRTFCGRWSLPNPKLGSFMFYLFLASNIFRVASTVATLKAPPKMAMKTSIK